MYKYFYFTVATTLKREKTALEGLALDENGSSVDTLVPVQQLTNSRSQVLLLGGGNTQDIRLNMVTATGINSGAEF